MVTKSSKNKFQIVLLLIPGLIIFGFFTVYPIFKLFYMSFFNWEFSTAVNKPFIGLQNYQDVLSDPFFHIAFVNTVIYTIVTVAGQMVIGLLIAVMVNQIRRFSVTFRILNYLPVITSWVIASLIFRYIFNTEGLLNYVLSNILHITNTNIRWLDRRWSGLSVAMLLGIWKGIGWNMVVFLAALQQVPQDLYEAAAMDGCNAFAKFFYITIPGIRGTILFVLIMLTIGGFNVFTSIKMITGGNPAHQTETLLTWMYHKAFTTGKFGYAAALSFVIAFSLGILAFVQFRVAKKIQTTEEGAE